VLKKWVNVLDLHFIDINQNYFAIITELALITAKASMV